MYFRNHLRLGITVGVVLFIAAIGAGTRPYWLPWTQDQIAKWKANQPTGEHEDEHTGHDHGNGHSEESAITLSPNALKNIGFRPATVEIGRFTRTITLPAMVAERPGRSQIQITAPLTGVVTKIVPVQGSAIAPGSPMFDLRLTDEKLVTAQRDFLYTIESLDVVNREIARLKSIEEVVARNKILEQEYEKQKLDAKLRAERQGLILHGLSEHQVDRIAQDRQLIQKVTVLAPIRTEGSKQNGLPIASISTLKPNDRDLNGSFSKVSHLDSGDACGPRQSIIVQTILITLGEQVTVGQVMAVLADHCELYVEGRAFEDDAVYLRDAARESWDISATLLTGSSTGKAGGLKLLYLGDRIESESRALHVYVILSNEIVLNQLRPNGQRFIEWRYKPGQRMELQIPVEVWNDRIILPVEAIVEEGAETYLYRQNGKEFVRVPVHVEYRDNNSVVIANDGSVFPGDVVAAKGAYQMHLALKNKAGGGIDPHAGHNH